MTGRAEMVPGHWARLGRRLYALYLFTRCSILSLSLVLPLLGAASVAPTLPAAQIVGLLLVALCFHLFGGVHNDLIDLRLDQSEPLRAEFPLVRGAVRPWQAWALVGLQPPLALLLTAWLGGGIEAHATILLSFLCIAIYNVQGKQVSVPPLTDAIQGVGWGLLALYGALIAPGTPSPLTALLVGWVVLFILLINGVHGGLRDLGNDLHHGARTTALWLGARPTPGGVNLSRPLLLYALALQVLLSGLLWLPAVQGWVPTPTWALLALTLLLGLVWFLTGRIAQATATRWALLSFGTWHSALLLTALLVPFLPLMEGALLGATLAAYWLPMLSSTWLYRVGETPSLPHSTLGQRVEEQHP